MDEDEENEEDMVEVSGAPQIRESLENEKIKTAQYDEYGFVWICRVVLYLFSGFFSYFYGGSLAMFYYCADLVAIRKTCFCFQRIFLSGICRLHSKFMQFNVALMLITVIFPPN